jgi:tetratricopeptide (TPR) repeat protein
MLHWERGEYRECLGLYARSRTIYREKGDEARLSQLLGNMAIAHWGVYDFGPAKALLEEQMSMSRRMGDKQTFAIALGNLAGLLLQEGDFARAESLISERMEFALRFGDRKNYCISLGQKAQITYQRGELERAEGLFLGVLEEFEKLGLKYYVGYYLTMLAETALARGDREKAGGYLERASGLAAVMQVKELSFNVRKLKARMSGPAEGLVELRSMLGEGGWNDAEKADLHYETYQLSGDDEDRSRARELYERILAKAPIHEYKLRLAELNGEG